MAGKTVIALAVGVLLTVNATVRAYTADDYIQSGRQSMFDRTLTGLWTAHEIYSQGLEDPQCGDCATDRQLHFLHALARTYMLLVRDDGGALDSAWELAEAFGATVEGDRFFPFEMSGAIALNEQGEYEIPPTAPDADELQTMLEEFTLPELAAILAELDLISESPGDPFVIYLTPAETGLGDDLEVDYGDVLVFRALVAGAKGVLEAESAYDIFVDPNDPLVEHLYQDNLSVNDDLLGRYPGLLKVLPTPGHPADGTAILAQARQDLIAGIDAYFEAVAYILAEEDDQQNDLLYIETGDRRTFDQVQMVLGKLRDSLTTDTPITEPTTTIETYAVRDEQDTERGQLQLEFGPFGEGQGGYLDLIADTGLPSSWFVEDFSIWGDELIAEVVLDESREPPYTGWHNLTNAPSVLFEPTGPDDYLVTILDESLFVAGGTAQNWHGDETTWTYALPFSFPYYGQSYSQIIVFDNGVIDFQTSSYMYPHSYYLMLNKRIAPFFSFLHTVAPYDIYIDESLPDQVTIRWHANNAYNNMSNFSVTLFSDGRIRFDYGQNDWSRQYVGISRGNQEDYIFIGGLWSDGVLTGRFNPDRSRLGQAEFTSWGLLQGTTSGLWADRVQQQQEQVSFDPNPILAGTPRYPQPLAPRDLLPEFDAWNGPLPDTVGQGLLDQGATTDEAASLGGILPGVTQNDWNEWFNLQPAGDFGIRPVSPEQFDSPAGRDGTFVQTWQVAQLVWTDTIDPDDLGEEVDGVNIDQLYLGCDASSLYGTITVLNPPTPARTSDLVYDLYFSYCPAERTAAGSLWMEIYVNETMWDGTPFVGFLYRLEITDDGYCEWDFLDMFPVRAWEGRLDFVLERTDVPALAGRFLTLEGEGWGEFWDDYEEDDNPTHLRILGWDPTAMLGRIQGTVTRSGPAAAGPIYVQAFTDPHDPDTSRVAQVHLAGPGPYTLEGIGLGWQGYVRAVASLDKFNPFAENHEYLTDQVGLTVTQQNTAGIDLHLAGWQDYCPAAIPIEPNEPYAGSTEGATGEDCTSCACDDWRDVWHRFVADRDGIFALTLVGLGEFEDAARLSVFDECGGEELLCLRPCESDSAYLNAQAGEDYYLRVAGVDGQTGSYLLTVLYHGEPIPHDLCENALLLEPNEIYLGSTIGATGSDITDCACGDDYDVWHRFTAAVDGLYRLELSQPSDPTEDFWPRLSVFDACGGEEILCHRPCQSDAPLLYVQAGRQYLIRVAGRLYSQGLYTLRVRHLGPPLANDLCENAIRLDPNASILGTTVNATGADCTSCACEDAYDVWYRFGAPADGIWRLELEGLESFAGQVRMAVFDGCGGEELLCYRPCYNEHLYLNARAEREYLVRVAGRDLATGPFVLGVYYDHPAVAGDEWDQALPLSINRTTSGTTEGASGDDISSCGCGDAYDIWHRFTAPVAGQYHLMLAGEEADMRVSVFQPSWPAWCGRLDEITCGRPCQADTFYFPAAAGETFYIRVAALDGETGVYTLRCEKRLAADMNDDGQVNAQDLLLFSQQWLEDQCQASQWCSGADLDLSGTVNLGDYVQFLQYWLVGDN